MSGLKSYNVRKLVGLVLIVGYAFVALVFKPANNTELFPFFNWSLFSQSSNPKVDNVIIFQSLNGQKLDKPTLFFDLKSDFDFARRRDSRVAKAIDRWVGAEKSGDKNSANALRAMAEANFFREVDTAEYQVAQIQFDPIDRYKTGAIQITAVVAEYQKK